MMPLSMEPSPDPIGILSLQYYCFPDELGGAWNFTHEINKRLAARGHRVHLVTCKPANDLPDRETIDGVEFHRIATPASKSIPALWKAVRQAVRQVLDQGPINLVHIHNPLVGALALSVPGLWRIPRVYHFHSCWYDEEKINREGDPGFDSVRSPVYRLKLAAILNAIRLLEWTCYFFSRAILFLSDYSRRRFLRYFPFPKSRLIVIPGGVDVDRFQPLAEGESLDSLRSGLDLPADRPVFLTVRRLEARMGLENLIEAAGELQKRVPEKPFLLLIGGKGALFDKLHHLINHYGLEECVRLLGPVPGDQLPLYFRAADLFVMPTTSIEGFGLATVEALASGVPVLGTPVGGTVEILKPISSQLLFENTHPNAMADKMEEFLRKPKPFRTLSGRCRDTAVDRYSWESVVERMEQEFSSLARKG